METANRAYVYEERPETNSRIDEEWLELMLYARAMGLSPSEVRQFLLNPTATPLDNPTSR